MADELENPAQAGQHNEDANEETVERSEPLTGDTNGHEGQGEVSSSHSRARDEAPRPHEDNDGRTKSPGSAESHDSLQTFRCWHESNQSSEIEDFIYEPEQPSPAALRSRLFEPKDSDCGAWASPSNPKCPASFGDDGTTATAGAFGQLVQISDYLGAGNSGMFSAGHCYVDEPYLVTGRARDLHDIASETFKQGQGQDYLDVFGLKFLNLELLGEAPPRLRWFQYQWPRYEYQRRRFRGMENIGMTIQFIARNKTVFQQCILENRGKADVDLELAFCKYMSIWDLDHVTDDYEFNKTTSNYQNAGPGPGGFGWVHVNRFEELSDARTDSQHSSHKKKPNSSRANCNTKDEQTYGVALVTSMAVDGEMMRFSPGGRPHIWKQTLNAKSSTSGSRYQKLEIVTAYKLVLLADPLSEWKSFVTPLKDMNPSKLLRQAEAVSLFRGSTTRTSGNDLAYSYDKRHSEAAKYEENLGEAGIVNASQDEVVIIDSEQQTEPSPAVDHEPRPEKTEPTMDHIDFVARRNLEHILGVCSIPVAVHAFEEDTDDLIWEKLRDVEAIALSCGDLSGHRVCTTSSFFAFQFLATVAKRLGHLPQTGRDGIRIQNLLSRLRNVCLGHLKWLYAAEKTDQDGAFRSLYWVSGEAVNLPKSSDTCVPLEHVRNTAFQILKAIEFANAFNGDEYGDSSLVGEIVSQWGRGWVRWLERSDRRESLTWHHREDEGLKVFRLDDHVWIWRALKAMEDERHLAWAIPHDRAQHNDRSSSTDSKAPHSNGILRHSHNLASRTVQREVLQKFTTEHEILRKRMVALTRSPRETRFLFHARDTAMFYGQDMGFFSEETAFRKVWNNTIDAQRFHEHNQEARWDNALRYALAIMLGIKGHQINNREPGYMVRTATEVLLRSSSENGLFPGKLDIMTKAPLEDVFHMEEDADSYYEAGFEIPYILLIHAREIRTIIDNAAEPGLKTASGEENLRHHPTGENLESTEAMPVHHTSNAQVQLDEREEDRELREVFHKKRNVLSAQTYIPNSTSTSGRTELIELAVDAQLALKKAIPFSNIIDTNNIVEIEDEWLFNYPDFFSSEKDENISIDEALDSLKDFEVTWPKSIDVAEMRRKYSYHNDKDSETSSYYSSSIATESSISIGDPGDSKLRILSMPSRKGRRGKRAENFHNNVQLGPFEYIWGQMCRPRTVTKAKKRVISWSGQDTGLGLEAALLCYAASKGDERTNMLEFCERHFRHENFMFDHCNLAYNIWDTEVHLSYFILGDMSAPLSGDAALSVEELPGVEGKHISRGSRGFRFHGDAFDRYWTLHLFSNMDTAELPRKEDVFSRLMDESFFFQRKVLELHLISRMLSNVESSTEEILAEVKSEIGIRSGAFSWSIPSMDTYSSWSKLWEGFAPLLQSLGDDLTSALDVTGQWETREGDRGQERPRWTHNDERKYRAHITRGQRLLKWRKKGIQKLLDDIESLREACTARLANAREELSFRSNQNIASFTFVTIVFLPLGFAASVFGMNGYPAGGWVASMAVIAVVALAITSTALANAKLLLAVAGQLYADALRFTGAVFQSSLIGQRKRQRDERAQASTTPDKPTDGDRKGNKSTDAGQKGNEPLPSHATRHVLFWMAYLLIELPARRVALACRALPSSLIQSLGLPRTGTATPPESLASSTDGPAGPLAGAIGRKVIRITGGILILPLLLISWTTQLLFYNVLDILTVLGRLTRKTVYALVAPSNADGAATDAKIVSWLIDPPSSLRPVRKFMSSNEKSEKPPPQTDGPGVTDRSDAVSPEEV